jgi:hypothetical protein
LDWPLARDEFRARTAPGREIPDRQPICHVASYYLAHPDLPRRVRLVAPDARIVVMLRHPVLRSYSQWLYQWRLGTEHLSFGDALLAESSRLGSA